MPELPGAPRTYTLAVKLNGRELEALERLAEAERLPKAQLVRRMIWKAAQQLQRDDS